MADDDIPSRKDAPTKMVCGLLAILAPFSIHRFLLGDSTGGLIRIALMCVCGVGSIISFVEGIMMLTKTDDEFYQIYVVEKKKWF